MRKLCYGLLKLLGEIFDLCLGRLKLNLKLKRDAIKKKELHGLIFLLVISLEIRRSSFSFLSVV